MGPSLDHSPRKVSESLAVGRNSGGQHCPLAWTQLVAFGHLGLDPAAAGPEFLGGGPQESSYQDPSQATSWPQAGTPEQRAQPQQTSDPWTPRDDNQVVVTPC